jgi:crotonobetainyl-CoA:carnitine CoA-transferase CaiB-like acyl-CoA transferase
MTPTPGALSGIRVLDLTRVLAAPFSTQILGDLGADVIKIERTGVGDDGRKYGFSWLKDSAGQATQDSSFYVCCNRNKRSLTVDLSKPAGQDIVRDLALHSDVLVENYKVGDLKRYRLDYESLKPLNTRLIYCSITGYGQTGPSASKPGYDGLFQAQGGMMAVTGIPDGQPGAGPLKAGPSMVDVLTGHNACIAILAALIHRQQCGEGQYIDMALLDSAVAMVSHIMQDYLISGVAPPRLGNGGSGGGPADLIECRDGIVYLTTGTDEHWRRLCELAKHPEWMADPRFATNPLRGHNRNELLALINQWSRQWSVTDLLEAFNRSGLAAARYNELAQVWEVPEVQHRGLRVRVPHPAAGTVDLIGSPMAHMSATPARITRAPPMLGEHTHEVLSSVLGLSDARITELRQQKII